MTHSGRPVAPLVVVLGLMLGPAVALGLARFAYALILPAMRTALGWSFATAGAMNTANALGYLIGAPLAGALAKRLGERRIFVAGMAVTALALLASGASADTLVLLVIRAVAGAGGAVCFVVGAGLAAQAGRHLPHGRAAMLLGVYFAGGGTGIVLSGLAVPPVLAWGGWRAAWLVLGVLSLVGLAGAVPAARAVPAIVERADSPEHERPSWWRLSALLGCYGLFGAGYIAYMTFIVAALTAGHATSGEITAFWTVLGVTSVGAAFGWGPLLGAWRSGTGIAVILAILTVGAVLPVMAINAVTIAASALLFGTTFLSVVTAVTAAARRVLPPGQWTSAIATLTVAFALGQCAGPVLSGALADRPTGVRAGLALGAALLALGSAVALAHNRLAREIPAR
ncbi:MAG TPA: YbfB/YjiJ family MFS transporter [Pseudonocardia sp.]|nr:YbfB/YjiJ family MFS transporter [Pseudonocardia sp.]